MKALRSKGQKKALMVFLVATFDLLNGMELLE